MNNKTIALPFVSVCIVAILSPFGSWASAFAAESPVPVRVASYNVEYGENATPEEIGAMLKPFHLDLIGFCEAPAGDWTARVGKVLGMKYAYVGAISSANHKDKYKSILSKTPLDDRREFEMNTDTIWNPASAVRAVTTIRGANVAFYSLHIAGSDGKTGHAAELVGHILPKETEEKVVVVGDFNNRLGDAAIDAILRAGMQVTWKDLEIDVAPRYTYNALDPAINGGVIDHIFYNIASGGKVTAGDIVELEKHLSDHKPVWAEITFPVAVTP